MLTSSPLLRGACCYLTPTCSIPLNPPLGWLELEIRFKWWTKEDWESTLISPNNKICGERWGEHWIKTSRRRNVCVALRLLNYSLHSSHSLWYDNHDATEQCDFVSRTFSLSQSMCLQMPTPTVLNAVPHNSHSVVTMRQYSCVGKWVGTHCLSWSAENPYFHHMVWLMG